MHQLIPRIALILLAGALVAPAADLDSSYQALKDALSKKDAAQVKQLALETSKLAREAASAPAPAQAAEKDAWSKAVTYAKEVDAYTEYALASTAILAEPEVTIDLVTTLERQNPKSRYLESAYAAYFLALNKTGEGAKIPAIAEKALANLPESEDLLLVMVDHAMNRRQVTAAGNYAERLIASLKKHPVPEGVPPAEWEKKKTAALTRAYYMAGLAHGERSEHALCDLDLRAALPLVKGNETMLAATLFYLGVSNYHIGRQSLDRGRILEGAKFSEQAAAIRGAFQQQAWTNAHLMKAEAAKMVARK